MNATLPTPITNGAAYAGSDGSPLRRPCEVVMADFARELEIDCMTLALRLYGESPHTFSPETRECMNRWRPRVEALLERAAHYADDRIKADKENPPHSTDGDLTCWGSRLRPGT